MGAMNGEKKSIYEYYRVSFLHGRKGNYIRVGTNRVKKLEQVFVRLFKKALLSTLSRRCA
jgi:hypothetical protein